MSILSGKWWRHKIKHLKAVGDILGVTKGLNDEEKSIGRSAKNSYDHQAGQYEDGQKADQSDSQKAISVLAGSLTAASNAEADGDGDEE